MGCNPPREEASKQMPDATPRTDYLYRKTVKGRPYLYFRYPTRLDAKPTPLPPDEASPAFEREYDRCIRIMERALAEASGKPIIERPVKARAESDTIDAAIRIYRASPAYTKLKRSTQSLYDHVLNVMGS